jgi:hypothetical protein
MIPVLGKKAAFCSQGLPDTLFRRVFYTVARNGGAANRVNGGGLPGCYCRWDRGDRIVYY